MGVVLLLPTMVNDAVPREYLKIVSLVDTYLLSTEMNTQCHIDEDICTTGNIQIISRNFNSRDIPGGVNWRWNQTKSRKFTKMPSSGSNVLIFKLLPRHRKKPNQQGKLPKFKLWQLQIFPGANNPNSNSFHVLYCERGCDSSLHIEDFSFLIPFMDNQAARELWPNKLL